jgi:hypothetical protein
MVAGSNPAGVAITSIVVLKLKAFSMIFAASET